MKIKSIHFIFTSIASLLFACSQNGDDVEKKILRNDSSGSINSQIQIACMLDSFNIAATKADFDGYFKYFTEDATFMGTDATEHWDKKNFMIWAKPYFEKKRTWNFKSIERHIYFAKSGDFAWFDELLNTQMKICRGSGVVVKQNNEWKIQQYVLSMTIPNSETKKVIELKNAIEDSIIKRLSDE